MRKVNPAKKFTGKTPLIKAKNKLWNTIRTYIFNKYNFECYTCPQKDLTGSNCQLGHFHTAGSCGSDMFWHLDNLRPQCLRCNKQLNGNAQQYRYNLIDEIGLDKVLELDNRVLFTPRIQPWKVDRLEKEKEKVKEVLHRLDK